MKNKIVRFSVRMPVSTARMFEAYATLLGYRKSTFIFACAVDGLLQKVGRQEYFDMAMALSGSLPSEPSVGDHVPTDSRGSVNEERCQKVGAGDEQLFGE